FAVGRRTHCSTLSPYTTLFRSDVCTALHRRARVGRRRRRRRPHRHHRVRRRAAGRRGLRRASGGRHDGHGGARRGRDRVDQVGGRAVRARRRRGGRDEPRGRRRPLARQLRPARRGLDDRRALRVAADDADRRRVRGVDRGMTASFADRHIGTDSAAQQAMLGVLGYASVEELVDAAIPAGIRVAPDLASSLPPAASETEALAELRALAARNRVARPMIGLGYHGTHTPAVIQRNVLENPSWYTAYTPYQPEISQGRLEALLNFQTMVSDLTGLATANASMLDEGTAVVEGMLLARRASRADA